MRRDPLQSVSSTPERLGRTFDGIVDFQIHCPGVRATQRFRRVLKRVRVGRVPVKFSGSPIAAMVGVEVLQVSSTGQQVTAHFRSPAHVPRPPLVPPGKQIVVGVDGSPQSLRALEFAAERAGLTGEAVVAVLAFQHRAFAAGGALGVRAEDVKAGAQVQAQLRVEGLVEACAREHPDIEIRATAVLGRPVWVLKRLSDDASLLVMGSRGRTLMRETILGSVSQKVLHRAACPVIVVR